MKKIDFCKIMDLFFFGILFISLTGFGVAMMIALCGVNPYSLILSAILAAVVLLPLGTVFVDEFRDAINERN